MLTIGSFLAGFAAAGPLLLVTLTAHGLLLWAILNPRCRWLGPMVRDFAAERREVWLTIDDGPDGERTVALSTALRDRGVPATFFLIGERLRAQPEIAAVLLRDGHSLGNHTGGHPRRSFWCAGRRRVSREIHDGQIALQSIGVQTVLFRAPVGHKSPALHPELEETGLQLISWTVGGRDGWCSDPERVVRRVQAAVRPGAIIMLHEARAFSVPTILAVVDRLQAQGYTFGIPGNAALVDDVRRWPGARAGSLREKT